MKICIVNGSPKGKYSITLQTSLYLEKHFPGHTFSYLYAGQKLPTYEKDFSEPAQLLRGAELVVFSYPVYTFLAPSQLHRFIELVKASAIDLSGKYVTQITTSKHFYDVTAHRCIEDNCQDMGMKVIHGLSADMDDLLTDKGRQDAAQFMSYVAYCVENDIYEHLTNPAPSKIAPYAASLPQVEKSSKYDTVIVADIREGDAALAAMVEDFRRTYPYTTRIVNLAEYPFAGGCLGCFHCAGDGKCVYKDGFDSFLREKVQTADAVVYAFTIRDHSMGARFKMYDDRQFCNGHRTVTEGMPFGYIVCGDYGSEANLRTVIEARCEVGHNFLSGVGYDLDTIKSMSRRLEFALCNSYVQPRNFYGVGGLKIFRDLIWLMRGLMKADHDFYKKHGVYDFPQKKRGEMLKMCVLGSLVRNPKVKAKMGNKMNEGMIAPYKKVIDEAK